MNIPHEEQEHTEKRRRANHTNQQKLTEPSFISKIDTKSIDLNNYRSLSKDGRSSQRWKLMKRSKYYFLKNTKTKPTSAKPKEDKQED